MKRERSLHEEVHDTPAKPMNALDARLARFNADLDSIPPPPPAFEQKRDSVLEKIRPVSRSGSWNVEELLGDQKAYYERALAVAIGAEREAHQKERADRLQAAEDRRLKRRDDIVDAVIKGVALFLVLGFLGLVGKMLLLK
jgi:hypothetical protein